MIKILVTGGYGQLGRSIHSIAKHYENIEIDFTDVSDLNICNIDEIREYIKNKEFKYIVNCAAYTAVDKAEQDQTAARKLNAEAVKNIGIVSAENQITVIHISTDYVFDGKQYKPYNEDDLAIPESYYGETKLLGEKFLFENQSKSIVLRTSWLYSEFGNNFVKTMINLGENKEELGIVFDQIGSPTYAVDLGKAILTIIEKVEKDPDLFSPGIYHYSNEGVCSWYDFTTNIHQMMGINCKLSPIESKDFPTAAPRPFYSVLNKSKIKSIYNLTVPYWKDSLEECLKKLK